MFPPRENFFKVVVLTTNAYDKTKKTISSIAAGVVNLFLKIKWWIVCDAGISWFNKFRKYLQPRNLGGFPVARLLLNHQRFLRSPVVLRTKPASSAGKLKQTEESLQDLQKQALVCKLPNIKV